jgi:prophage DNA circulation protein
LPALVVAHRLYGDAARADEITVRNGARHPGALRGGIALEVLSE